MRYWIWMMVGLSLYGQGAAPEESYKAYTEAPRLILKGARLRLLTRERERESIRYQQFAGYLSNQMAMGEMGFALALAGRIGAGEQYCGSAANWVKKDKGTDLRQRALVYDWCGEKLEGGEAKALAEGLKRSLPAAGGIASLRDRAFVGLALVDYDAAFSERVMRETVGHYRAAVAPGLRAATPVKAEDLYPLMELLHVVRDNLEIDLRQESARYFLDLPLVQMLGYYPAAYPGKENEFRVMFFEGDGEPDLGLATMMRAAELALVALDNNAELAQSLQGWLMQDRYLLRSGEGIAYELLWANPYQPGLTYHHLPNSYHDRRNGRLFIRDNWEEESRFLCYYDGKIQLFEDGKRKLLRVSPATPPVEMGGATILVGGQDLLKPVQFELAGADREAWYIVGLRANAVYDVEVDEQEIEEARTDAGGILSLEFVKPLKAGVRVMLSAYAKGSE
ncbi:MAG: hypothetical protein ACK52Z_13360 [Acidobacteriota bacterium]